ncbi:MAG TPA: AlpA family phage regulatory protein [Steroidobacteraceae bacterium]|nr:AlpA family phage regulatory protein [Steroidobacteraceae bacterium]
MKLIPYSDLKEKKGIKYSRVHVSRLEKADKFPKHVNLGPQSIGWLEEEIDAWIEARAAERSEKPAQAAGAVAAAPLPQTSTGNEVVSIASAERRKAENAKLWPREQEPAS